VGGTEGMVVKSLKFLGVPSQNDSLPFEVFWPKLVKSIKNHKKPQKLQTLFCCALCD
jgi:hypothetical protein